MDSGVSHDSNRSSVRPKYQTPRIRPMSEAELMTTFQMTAADISAAGCWWTTSAC
jgi:hypothetical protein